MSFGRLPGIMAAYRPPFMRLLLPSRPVPAPSLLASILIPENPGSRVGRKMPARDLKGLLLPALHPLILTTALFAVPSCISRQGLVGNASPDERRYLS